MWTPVVHEQLSQEREEIPLYISDKILINLKKEECISKLRLVMGQSGKSAWMVSSMNDSVQLWIEPSDFEYFPSGFIKGCNLNNICS